MEYTSKSFNVISRSTVKALRADTLVSGELYYIYILTAALTNSRLISSSYKLCIYTFQASRFQNFLGNQISLEIAHSAQASLPPLLLKIEVTLMMCSFLYPCGCFEEIGDWWGIYFKSKSPVALKKERKY